MLRKKPNKVLCKEVTRISLVSISRKVRDKIVISFNNAPVDRLSQIQLDILNKGSEVIKDISLTFKFAEGTKVLDTSFESIPESLEVHSEPIEDGRVLVTIPFLNPIRPHKHRIRASIVCDGNAGDFKVIGSGEGWSLDSVRLPSTKQSKRRFLISNGILLVEFLLVFLIYMPFVEQQWGISSSEISLRALIASLPVLIVFILTLGWGIKGMFQRLR